MRWYLGDRMPDEKVHEEADPDPNRRVLAKRKSNYSALDFINFHYQDGVLQPEKRETDTGMMVHLRRNRAENVIREAIGKFAQMGVRCSEAQTSTSYLPRIIQEHRLGRGLTKPELAQALRQMMLNGEVTISQVKGSDRHIYNTLLVQSSAGTAGTI
jgi:hypothetical protein